MHILLIAPCAPPKNSPEAIQVKRFLDSLDPSHHVTLVKTRVVGGWQNDDSSLSCDRENLHVIELALPLHRFSARLLGHRFLRGFHVPDEEFWIRFCASRVLKSLRSKPDIIYSRSFPFSAAELARQLKKTLGIPWIMYFSDPWIGSPYRHGSATSKQIRMENACVGHADSISLTTHGQMAAYQHRYKKHADKFFVTPNMMPKPALSQTQDKPHNGLKEITTLVHIGALYGDRDPTALIEALNRVLERFGDDAKHLLNLSFYGNMIDEYVALVNACPLAEYHGVVSYDEAQRQLYAADIVVSVEPAATHELHRHFLLSKVVDYLASPMPLLALTPSGSETDRYCARGYGVAFEPDNTAGIETQLSLLVEQRISGVSKIEVMQGLRRSKHRPEELEPEVVLAPLVEQMETAIAEGTNR